MARCSKKDDELAEIEIKKLVLFFKLSTCYPYHGTGQCRFTMIYAGYSKSEEPLVLRSIEQVNLGDRMDHQPNQLSWQRQRVLLPEP
jgi:putative ABC transport system ATP-binding protein